MAGSANVTPMPSRNAMRSTNGSADFDGSVVPMVSPKGMSPTLSPSMNIISPKITETRPPPIIHASDTLCLRIRI
jgi:hypothetical protein